MESFTGEDSPMATLLLSVMGAFAEFERALILERQREGIAAAKQRGAVHRPQTRAHRRTGAAAARARRRRRTQIHTSQRLRHQPRDGLQLPPPDHRHRLINCLALFLGWKLRAGLVTVDQARGPFPPYSGGTPTIAAGVKVSVGVVHKTVANAQQEQLCPRLVTRAGGR
ncbi:recombinase family protein [Nonomuraea sp. NBC_00507]|uniref:recombinase family protein n=1 Tax=Nonomuraea sp. NBC_00507 TaxID=2976002 RepID=UPI003FA58C0A